MNLDTKQRNDIVEAVTGIGGVFIIGGTLLSVYTGTLGVPVALEIILPILGALGIYESGRRRGKKSPLVKMVLEQVDALGEQQGMQESARNVDEKARVSETSESDPRTDMPDPRPRREEAPSTEGANFITGPTSEASSENSGSQAGSTYAQVTEAIERADYGTLRQVATRVDGAQGSGEGNTAEKMRDDLRAADPAAVASAFESVTANRTDGSG